MNTPTGILDRRALFSTGAAAALLAATGVSAAAMPKRGGRLRLALSGSARSDHWDRGNGLFMQVARQGLIYDSLTEVAADGTVRGELSTRWHVGTDARNWVFDLREGVVFHDETPFGAADVVASLAPLLDQRAVVTVVAHHRIRIVLQEPDVGLPFTLSGPAYPIRPAHAPDAGIGTGLYKLRHFAPGQQVLVTRVNDHYKDGSAGWFDEVELVSIPSELVRAQAMTEYLVDAVDLTDGSALRGYEDIALYPAAHRPTHAVSRRVAMPTRTGRERPLDNLRAAERWWCA